MKRLSILGSTGSIGQSTLAVVAEHPGEFQVAGLAAGRKIQVLAEQIQQFRPALVSVQDEAGVAALRDLLPPDAAPEILCGAAGVLQVATGVDADMVVSAMVGAVGLPPTLAAVEAGIPVALANKETLVAAGDLVMAAAQSRGVPLIPVDSEHSAIFQALQGERAEDVRRLWRPRPCSTPTGAWAPRSPSTPPP
jgi:1-deoxy-D-xylulose-5-phosphate reductoisomerase